MVDYDSKLLYDSYITLTFHQVIKDENDKVLKKEDVSYNYDIKRKKLMDVKDVLKEAALPQKGTHILPMQNEDVI